LFTIRTTITARLSIIMLRAKRAIRSIGITRAQVEDQNPIARIDSRDYLAKMTSITREDRQQQEASRQRKAKIKHICCYFSTGLPLTVLPYTMNDIQR